MKATHGIIDNTICLKHLLRIGLFVVHETDSSQNDSPQKLSSIGIDILQRNFSFTFSQALFA